MRRLFFLWIFLILSQTTVAENSNNEGKYFKDFKKISAAGIFYDEDMGTIAFLPSVGREEYINRVKTFLVLPESGYYKLSKKGNLFFMVNHHASKEKESSYLGVFIYLIYPKDSPHHRYPINLIRNKANWQAGPDKRELMPSLKGPNTPSVTIANFFEAHQDGKKVKDADDILKFTWHALIEDGTLNSFNDQLTWFKSNPIEQKKFNQLLNNLGLSKDSYEGAINSYILQFTTSTTSTESSVPLVFYFNSDDASGAYMKTFSPAGEEFGKEFYFKFE